MLSTSAPIMSNQAHSAVTENLVGYSTLLAILAKFLLYFFAPKSLGFLKRKPLRPPSFLLMDQQQSGNTRFPFFIISYLSHYLSSLLFAHLLLSSESSRC
jgi:hypothetical protein